MNNLKYIFAFFYLTLLILLLPIIFGQQGYWGAYDTRVQPSYSDVKFPVTYFSELLCDYDDIAPYSKKIEYGGYCLGGVAVYNIPQESIDIISGVNFDFRRLINKNETLIILDYTKDYNLLNSSIIWKGYSFSTLNMGKRFDIYLFGPEGKLYSLQSNLCAISINFGSWPDNVLVMTSKKEIVNEKTYQRLSEGFVMPIKLGRDRLIVDGNLTSIILESDNITAMVSFNNNSNNLLYNVYLNEKSETIVSICSYSSYINISLLNSPHIHLLKKESNNISKDELLYLSVFKELETEIDTIYNYNGSETIFNPTIFDNKILVNIGFSHPSGIKWNPRIDYFVDGEIKSKYYSDVTTFNFNDYIDLKGNHFEKYENILFPFSSYSSNIAIYHFPTKNPKSDVSKLDENYDVKTSFDGRIMFIEVFPNKTIKTVAILYILLFIYLIIRNIKLLRNGTSTNYKFSYIILAVISLLAFGILFGFFSLPLIETYFYIGILFWRYVKGQLTLPSGVVNFR